MLGLPLERLEDERLLRGQGRYTDDLAVENTGHAVFIRSDRAHAVIQEIEKAAAERAPGVRLVLTGRDAAARELGQLRPMASVPGQIERTRPVIADETVRHVGEIVAMVVADTLDWARDAAEAIVVRTSDRPCAVEVAYDWHTGDADAVGRAFARAHTVARITTKSNRVVVHPLEPRCAIGWYDAPSGRYTLHTPTQGVHQVRDALADHVFAIERERIRVITEDVGGAFGMKLHPYPEHALVLLAARLTGAPVRWQATRSEAALADAHGRAQTLEGALALDAQGRFLALQVRNTADLGAYYSHFGPPTPSLSRRQGGRPLLSDRSRRARGARAIDQQRSGGRVSRRRQTRDGLSGRTACRSGGPSAEPRPRRDPHAQPAATARPAMASAAGSGDRQRRLP